MGNKNSMGGPKWVVKQDRLLESINCEKQLQTRMLMLIEREKVEDALEQNLQLEQINIAIKTWFRLYHSVVLLVAAKNQTDIHPINTPEEGFISCPPSVTGKYCLEESYVLPAFGLEEDDDFSLSGLKFDKTIKEFSDNYRDGSLGEEFVNLSFLPQPIFKDCLNNYKPVSLSPAKILETWKSSVSSLPNYGEIALSLIDDLWGKQIENHLADVNNWQSGSLEWWKTELEIDDDLERKIRNLYRNGTSDAQETVGQVASVTKAIGAIYTYIYNRFVYPNDTDYPELSHGLGGVVSQYPVSNQQVREGLLSITYAAVAWQIFNQVKLAIDRVRSVLAEG